MLARGEPGVGGHEDFAFLIRQAKQEAGVAVVLAAGGAAYGLRRAGAETETALGAIKCAGGFRLQLVHAGIVKLAAKANLVAALSPVEVAYVGKLGVVTVIRHEVILHADIRIVGDGKRRPAAFKAPRAVDAGDPQIEPELLIQAGLLDACIHARPADIGVHHEMRGKDVSCSAGETVSVADAIACI